MKDLYIDCKKILDPQIGDEHMSGRMRNHQRDPAGSRHLLRCHTTGPEHRDFVISDEHSVSVFGAPKIRNSEFAGSPDLNRLSMRKTEQTGQLDDTIDIVTWNRPHGNDKISMQPSAGSKLLVLLVHRYVASLLEMANRDAGILQQPIEREAAAQQEGYPVVSPRLHQVADLINKPPVFMDPVLGNIGSKIGSGSAPCGNGRSGIHSFEKRKRAGIEMTERFEFVGPSQWEYHQIRLHEPGSQSRSGPFPFSRSNESASLYARKLSRLLCSIVPHDWTIVAAVAVMVIAKTFSLDAIRTRMDNWYPLFGNFRTNVK